MLVERIDYLTELSELILDLLTSMAKGEQQTFRWERGDDEETMSA